VEEHPTSLSLSQLPVPVLVKQPQTGDFIALDSTLKHSVTVKDASQPEAPTLQRVKKRRSSRKARNKSLLQPENLRMPAEVSSESQKRSEQVNGEIEAIDSVLKALDTSGYSMSDMTTTLSGCTGFPMSQKATTEVSGNTVHTPIGPTDSVCSIQSLRLDSSSSDSCSSTDSSDESVAIG
jgi:hypothetical protein